MHINVYSCVLCAHVYTYIYIYLCEWSLCSPVDKYGLEMRFIWKKRSSHFCCKTNWLFPDPMLSRYPSPTFRAIDRRRVKCVAASITWKNPCRQHGWPGPCVSFLCCNGKENSKERAHTHTPKLTIYRLCIMVNHVFCSIFFLSKIFLESAQDCWVHWICLPHGKNRSL